MTQPVVDRMESHHGTRDPLEAFNLDLGTVHAFADGNVDAWRDAYIAQGVELPEHTEIRPGLGITHYRPDAASLGEAYHFREQLHPLQNMTLEQIESLPWYTDENWQASRQRAIQQTQQLHQRGLAVVGSAACTIFEHAWYLRGMDQLFFDLFEQNEVGQFLLDKMLDKAMHQVDIYCEAGVDMIQFGDDVGVQRGMMMSVDFWREHFKPRLARVMQYVREREHQHTWIAYHSDGDIRKVLPDLIDIGLEVLNPVQPECMPVDELVPQYQNQLAYWGIIGTQTTMPFGSVEDVRQMVRHCASLARNGARIILAPTHVLEPDVPWNNIEALVDEAQQHRW